jgi:hypothetical protein
MEWKRKMQCTTAQGSHKRLCDGSSSKNLFFALVRQVDSPECKLWVSDFKLPSDRFNTSTSRLLALHRCHRKGTTMHIILVLWDRDIVMVRVGTMQTGVQGSIPIRLQL